MGLRDAFVVARLFSGRNAPIQTGSRSRVACAQFDLRRDVVEQAARRVAEFAKRFEGSCTKGDARSEAQYLESLCASAAAALDPA